MRFRSCSRRKKTLFEIVLEESGSEVIFQAVAANSRNPKFADMKIPQEFVDIDFHFDVVVQLPWFVDCFLYNPHRNLD